MEKSKSEIIIIIIIITILIIIITIIIIADLIKKVDIIRLDGANHIIPSYCHLTVISSGLIDRCGFLWSCNLQI